MMDDKETSELDAFENRLKKAQENADVPRGLKSKKTDEPPKGIGLAMRCASDLLAGLLVGVAIGYGLDTYVFGTTPWLMVVFFFLGAAAGIMNVFRTVNELGMAQGLKQSELDRRNDENLRD